VSLLEQFSTLTHALLKRLFVLKEELQIKTDHIPERHIHSVK